MPYRHVGTNLRRLRDKKFMTQVELAEALSVDVRTVQRIERGERTPSKKTLQAICAYFDIPPETLMDDSPSPLPLPNQPGEETTPSFSHPTPLNYTLYRFPLPEEPPPREEILRVQVRPYRDAQLTKHLFTSAHYVVYEQPPEGLTARQQETLDFFHFLLNLALDHWGECPEEMRDQHLRDLEAQIEKLKKLGLVFSLNDIEAPITTFAAPDTPEKRVVLAMAVLPVESPTKEICFSSLMTRHYRRDLADRLKRPQRKPRYSSFGEREP